MSLRRVAMFLLLAATASRAEGAQRPYFTLVELDDDLAVPVATPPLVIDGATGQRLDGATVRVRQCPTCPVTTVTTPTMPRIHGSFTFGAAGLPITEETEAVEVQVTHPAYLGRTVFLHARRGELFTGRSIGLFAGAYTDTDGDGLPDVQERAIGTDPGSADTDGDDLPDAWEVNGHDFVDYAAAGASPRHRDLFVECDFMQGQRPRDEAISDVVAAFARAPVTNPDGVSGVALHVQIDEELPRVEVLAANPFPEIAAMKSAHFSPRRLHTYHYCVFAVRYGTTDSSGRAEVNGTNFLVTLGLFAGGTGTRIEQAGTFMHELGHNLGLRHGGSVDENFKPNYLSIMNYSFQLKGLRFNGADGLLDYSRFTLASLDENALNEAVGLEVLGGTDATIAGYGTYINRYTVVNDATSRIDWNRNNTIDAGTVAAEVNCDPPWPSYTCTIQTRSVLTGYDDWANLSFAGGGLIGQGGGLLRLFNAMTSLRDDDPCARPDPAPLP